jgi:hypothetical protein
MPNVLSTPLPAVRPADQEADADRHEADLVTGEDGDQRPQRGAREGRHRAGGDAGAELLLGGEALARQLETERIGLLGHGAAWGRGLLAHSRTLPGSPHAAGWPHGIPPFRIWLKR